MTETLALGVAAASLRRLAGAARGARTRERVERLAALAEADPEAHDLNLGQVVHALFADADEAAGVARLRDLRSTLRDLAARHGVELAFEVDGQKHAAPSARRCWFVGVGDQVRRIERLSSDATAATPGSIAVKARARRSVQICVDGPETPEADDLERRLREGFALDRELDVEITSTRLLAGEPRSVRPQRLAAADVVVCLLSHGHLAARGCAELGSLRVVVPVALETLGDRVDLRGFENPFVLDGRCYAACRQRKAEFVNALQDTIAARLRPTPPAVADRWPWQDLLTGELDAIVQARAQQSSLERVPRVQRGVDATVDVQQFLRDWAATSDGRPYLVIFGEYGMGKTTACQVFTRALLQRREDGDQRARLPIYLDLRRLGDVKLREPTLEQILDDLLSRAWQSGAAEPRATAADVIEQVQRRGAVVIFDGLDEVLVHLSETAGQALLRELWKILPPRIVRDPGQRALAGRVLLTCRTHFFRTLREQHTYFRGEDREIVGADSYAALHLLPFNEQQVRAYLERRESDARGDGVDRALQLIRSVHNLSELVQRPFNLRLVVDQLGVLERRIASGDGVDTAALYDELVASWLGRDVGKHQLRPPDKLRLMEELAASLWRAGRRSLPIDRLEAWLHERLDTDDELGRWFRLSRADVAVLAEDLRTATFIVRPGSEEFEFAHTSLLEYFLARRLARALAEGDVDVWALPRPSIETLDFLGELIAAGDTDGCLQSLRELRGHYRPQASELTFEYCLHAAGRGAPAIALTGFALQGADVRAIRVAGPPGGALLRLSGCQLTGADLREARFERVHLEDCDLSGADLTRAELHDSTLERLTMRDAKLGGVIVRGCRARSLDLVGAQAHRTQWLMSDLNRVRWPASVEGHLIAPPTAGGSSIVSPDRRRARLTAFAGLGGPVLDLAVAPDGARLATAGFDGVIVWDVATGERLLKLPNTDDAEAVAYARDGTRLATAGFGGVIVWDAATGEQLLKLPNTAHARAVAYARDGTRLATAGFGGVIVWDAATGEQLLKLPNTAHAQALAYARDGTRLATASFDGVIVWDAATGERLLKLPNTAHARAVAYAPDGTRLATASFDGVIVWDAATGEQLLKLPNTAYAEALAYAPDGTRLATASLEGVIVRDAATGEQLLKLPNTDNAEALAYAPDGTRLATASLDGVIVRDAATGEQLLKLPNTDNARAVAYAPDGTRLATASLDGVIVRDAATGEQLLKLPNTDNAQAVAYAPDGTRLATASLDGVIVRDAATGEQLLKLPNTDNAQALAYARDGTRLATASFDGVIVWEAATAEQLLKLPNTAYAEALAYAPDGTRLATASFDGVIVWDAATGEQLLKLPNTAHAQALAYARDGTRLATASFDGVIVWDAATGERLLKLPNTDNAQALAYAPDGTRLATASFDGVIVWEAATGERLLKLPNTAHAQALAYAPDGTHLATISGDGGVRVCNSSDRTARMLAQLLPDSEYAVFAGERLISCSVGAWRWLGWLAPSPKTGELTRYPAETFGPLAVAH